MSQEQLTKKICEMAAGCSVDMSAVEGWGIEDVNILTRLADQYHMGWLHNVMARITPLTLERVDDYLVMADLFINKLEEAEHVLDRFDSDLELFCSVAGIAVTKHMTTATISEELESHVALYMEVEKIFAAKFKEMTLRDPIKQITHTEMTQESSNEFIKSFIDTKFDRLS